MMASPEEVQELRDAIYSSLPLGSPCNLGSQLDSDDELDQQYLQVPEQQVNEVVFVREHVCVWPTRSRCISGRLSLVKQHCELFMAWLPYACGQLQQDGSFKADAQQAPGSADAMLYAVLPLPVSEVRWLRPCSPRTLWGVRSQRLEVGLASGVTLAPLHFPPGTPSMHRFVELVRQHVGLIASPQSKDTWLVNAVPAPLARSLDALDLGDICLGAPARAPGSGGLPAALTWAPPPPAPVRQDVGADPPTAGGAGGSGHGVVWPSWSSWVTHAETVWDAFSAQPGTPILPATRSSSEGSSSSSSSSSPAADTSSASDAGTAGRSPAAGVPGPPQAHPGLILFGRAAWHAVSAGVSKLVAQYSMYNDWFAADGDVEGLSAGAPREEAEPLLTGTKESTDAGIGSATGAPAHSSSCQQQAESTKAAVKGKGRGKGARDADGVVASERRLQLLRCEVQQEAQEVCGEGPWAAQAPLQPGSASSSSSNSSSLRSAAAPGAAAGNQPGPASSSVPVTAAAAASAGSAQGGNEQAAGSQQCTQPGAQPGSAGSMAAEPAGSGDEEYEVVEVSSQAAREAQLRAPPPPPLDEQELQALQAPDGQMSIAGVALLRERVWQGGVAPTARRMVWPLLLGLRDPHATHQQAASAATARREQYKALCTEWQAIVSSPHTALHRAWWQSCSRIDKDVGRTDRTHPAFAQAGGPASRALRRVLLSYITLPGGREYCQGMSDLAAPLLVVLGDEVEAFWGLAALMARLGGNFGPQQEAIHAQLAALQQLLQLVDPQLHAHLQSVDCQPYFFAFRWLLITFKREFPYEGALRVWEAVWSCPVSSHMHLYLAAAILVHYRQAILQQVHDLDGMLRFAVQLGGHMEPQPLLRLAGALTAAVGGAADELLATLSPTRMPPPGSAPCASADALPGLPCQALRTK